MVIVSIALCATKVYHTSYLSEAPHPGDGSVAGFQVAFTLVPAVLTHEVLEVKLIAAEHSSFAGCAKEFIEHIIPSSSKAKVA